MNYEASLQNIIFKMLNSADYMFYGLYLAELNKVFDDKIPTACVGRHSNASVLSLTLNKKFWEKTLYNDSRKMSILIHELEHIVREHLSDYCNSIFVNHYLANIAMDISINQCIKEELPRLDEEGNKCGVFIEDFPELNLKIDESSFYYYDMLSKGEDRKADSKGKKKSMSPNASPSNLDGTSGSPALDSILEDIEAGTYANSHSLWEELIKGMGEKEVDLLRKEIQEAIKRIADETIKQKGNLPVRISNALKNSFNNKPAIISWKTLFNRFVGSTISTDIYQSRKRPNFRFEDAPSNKYKSKIRIVVGCDSSGSVSDHELQEFFGQIKHMYKAGVKIDVAIWDANVHLEYEYKGENNYTRICQGGTYASSFIEYVNTHKNKKRWTCAINLTDGYIEQDPITCKLPMLWVITSGGSTSFNHKSKKIKMN